MGRLPTADKLLNTEYVQNPSDCLDPHTFIHKQTFRRHIRNNFLAYFSYLKIKRSTVDHLSRGSSVGMTTGWTTEGTDFGPQ
jgi:hypothetical protein